jgi:hypothetical protein
MRFYETKPTFGQNEVPDELTNDVDARNWAWFENGQFWVTPEIITAGLSREEFNKPRTMPEFLVAPIILLTCCNILRNNSLRRICPICTPCSDYAADML